MEDRQKAFNMAVSILGRKMYTCKELSDRLCKKGVSPDMAEEVVSELIRLGLIDDFRYAQMYIEDAVHLGAKGMYRIRQELYQKGISDSLIRKAVEDAETDEYAALLEYVSARQLFDHIRSRNELEKVKARLVRRGYSLRDIKKALDEMGISYSRFDAEE